MVAATILVSPAANAADSNKLVVMQDAPTLATAAHTEANTSGAVLFFAADLRNLKRKKIGELIGQVTTIDVTLDGVNEEDRFRGIVTTKKLKNGTFRHTFKFVN